LERTKAGSRDDGGELKEVAKGSASWCWIHPRILAEQSHKTATGRLRTSKTASKIPQIPPPREDCHPKAFAIIFP
jgi:hypothetical protein